MKRVEILKNKRSTAQSTSKSRARKQAQSRIKPSAKLDDSKVKSVKPIRLRSKKQIREYEDLIINHRENGRKLARSLLRRWRVTMPAEEIDSVVDLTLCEAALRFDKTKGASFITFLFYHLRGHLVRAVAAAASESNVFMALAASAGVDVHDWATASSEGIEDVWALVPELETSLHRDAESPENSLLKREKQGICNAACEKLDALEREIIERSYIQDEALVDIAKSLGYSRCHVSRVKKRALDRLKEHLVEKSLLEVIDLREETIERELGTERNAANRRKRRRRGQLGARDAERAAA